jgi:hypothetical protein
MTSPKRPLGVTIVAALSILQGLGCALDVLYTVGYYLTNASVRSIYLSNAFIVVATVILNLILVPLLIKAGMGLWRLKRPGIKLAQLGWTIRLISPILFVIIAALTVPVRSFNCTFDIISIGVLIYLSGLSKRLEYKEKTFEELPEMQDVTDVT